MSRLLPLAAAALLVACQAGAMPASPGATPSATTPSPAPTAKPSSAITVTDDEGTTITLAGPPRKVVSLTPATTELMFALGIGDRLVGRTSFDDYPPEAAAVSVVASFEGVEIEKVVDAAPDLVIAGGNEFTHSADIERLRSLGMNVLVVYAADLPAVLHDLRLVGTAVGQADAADTLADGIQNRIDEVTRAVGEPERPRTFYEIGDQPDLYGPAPDSFLADMVTLAGGDPITTSDPSSYTISMERLVDQDPQVIILGDAAYGTCPDAVKSRPGWQGISAVKGGDIRVVNDTVVTRPGPRIGDGLAALALAIHPDAAISAPVDDVPLCQAVSPS